MTRSTNKLDQIAKPPTDKQPTSFQPSPVNRGFLLRLLEHPAFAAAELETGFIARHAAELLPAAAPLPDQFWTQAAQQFIATQPAQQRTDDPDSPWAVLTGLRPGMPPAIRLHLQCRDEQRQLYLPAIQPDCGSSPAVRRGDVLFQEWQGDLLTVTQVDSIATAQSHAPSPGGLSAPMNGSIVRILVEPGEQVEPGTPLLVLEAMKMEHSILADQAGTVRQLLYAEGDMVSEGSLLLELEP